MESSAIIASECLPSHDWAVLRARAADAFAASGTTLTPLREEVIRQLLAAGGPVGAYDLAERVGRASGRQIAINSVYRILAACQNVGLVRRVETRHGYVVVHADEAGAALYLLCDGCGGVTAVTDGRIDTLLSASAEARGFAPAARTVEIAGRCRDCTAPAIETIT